MKNKRKLQKGFSLIEVLVVMTILAVIFGLVAKNVMGGQEKAKLKQAKIEVEKLAQSVQEFYLDVGRLPDSLSQLVNDTGDSMWYGPYVKEKELKDPWDQPYNYNPNSQHGGQFDIFSYGQDKSPGGEKFAADIGNWQ